MILVEGTFWPLVVGGDRLFRGEVTTVRSLSSAVSWLTSDKRSYRESE